MALAGRLLTTVSEPAQPGVLLPHPALQRIELRKKLDRAADQLTDALGRIVAMLDAIDGDFDIEDDETEDQGDSEPSLGSINRADQRVWAAGGCSDTEHEHDGKEPDVDREADYSHMTIHGVHVGMMVDDEEDRAS